MAVEYKKLAFQVDVSTADSKAVSAGSQAATVLSTSNSADTSSGTRTSTADSKAVSAQTYASSGDISAVTRLSTVDSSLQSQITAGGADSIARSMATSAVTYAQSADTSVVTRTERGVLTSNPISSTPTTLTVAQCLGYAHYVSAASAIVNLPAVSGVTNGAFFIIYMTVSSVLTIDPNASDRIILNGLALSDGYKIISDGTAGNFVTLQKDSADGWTVLGRSGYWSNGGA